MPSDPDHESIDTIIERVTVDANGDEGHVSFLCAFEDEVEYPISATLAGTHVVLHLVDDGNATRGLVASITNETGKHQIALTELDLDLVGRPDTGQAVLTRTLLNRLSECSTPIPGTVRAVPIDGSRWRAGNGGQSPTGQHRCAVDRRAEGSSASLRLRLPACRAPAYPRS